MPRTVYVKKLNLKPKVEYVVKASWEDTEGLSHSTGETRWPDELAAKAEFYRLVNHLRNFSRGFVSMERKTKSDRDGWSFVPTLERIAEWSRTGIDESWSPKTWEPQSWET